MASSEDSTIAASRSAACSAEVNEEIVMVNSWSGIERKASGHVDQRLFQSLQQRIWMQRLGKKLGLIIGCENLDAHFQAPRG